MGMLRSRLVSSLVVPSLMVACMCSAIAFAQSNEKEEAAEPPLVLEVGGTASRSITESTSSFGPSIALEATPIENVLEVEAGVTSLFRRHATEWDTDLLFKKPWDLSKKIEFMVGAGPEWIHSRAYGQPTSDAAALEIEPELMVWSSEKHRFGWYLEPSYEYKFGAQHEHSLGITVGLLIGLPKPHRH